MITIRRAGDRGGGELGWLNSRHSFSFGDYYDPAHMGYRSLRVLNDDRIAAGAGFPPHPHRDAEIVTYVVDGALEHRDSMGHGSVIRPGEVQRMTAGTGVSHSERNASKTDPVRLLQIWFLPDRHGLEPGYEQRSFTPEERRGAFRLVASREGDEGSVTIHQDIRMYVTLLGAGQAAAQLLPPERYGWLQVVRGAVQLARAGDQAVQLVEGDGVALERETRVDVRADSDSELLLFDLA